MVDALAFWIVAIVGLPIWLYLGIVGYRALRALGRTIRKGWNS